MKLSNEIKVGLFAVVAIAIIAFATIRVGDQSIVAGGAYQIKTVFNNATGLYPKASVEVAGVDVGVVKKIELTPEGRALATLGVSKHVQIPIDSLVFLRTKGFLGEAYIEIVPGDPAKGLLKDGETITRTESGGDVTGLVNSFNGIAKDISEITKTIKGWVSEEEGGVIATTIHNLDEFTRVMRDVSTRNEENLDRIMQNMADLTYELKQLVQENKTDVDEAMERVASITKKIDEGRGTLGKLVNDPETVEKLNDSLDNLNDALGGFRQLELGLGFHSEYLNRSNDFKNYVSLELRPTPDEALLIDIVNDPAPDTSRSRRVSDITAGGTTTTVTTENSVLERDSIHFSAQLAKKFYDLTLRGGLIESKGGVGLDYTKGPMGLSFSAFDFETDFNEQPHLKFMGMVNVTPNLYLLGGADDVLNPAQRTDYFFGGGFRFVDEDIKSLLGFARLR